MLQARLKKLLTTNWHFIGVILFFLIHGYKEYTDLIPVTELLLLLVSLLAASLLLFGISNRFFKSYRKAGIFTSFVLIVVLFFGVFQDFLSGFRLTATLSRLLFFTPLCVGMAVVLLIFLKRTQRPLNKPLLFINVLLLLYILLDIGGLVFRNVNDKPAVVAGKQLPGCDSCRRPSVYLILLDEYMGSQGLQEYFQYNNQPFEDSLRQEGFHVVQRPQSNYNLTIFSMASLLNMDYQVNTGKIAIQNHYAYEGAIRRIRNNTVSAWLEKQGYRIVNYSDFEMAQAAAGYNSGLLPGKIKLITNQTMWYRVAKNLPKFLVDEGLAPGLADGIDDDYIRNNEAMIERVLADSRQQDTIPVFTYLHLMMPHTPFVFDSAGKRNAPVWRRGSVASPDEVDQAYLQYLVYVNKRMYAFLHRLKQQTSGKAVMLLMSDHGYRGAVRKNGKFAWNNFNAVYLPGREYGGWYDGMTNVNQFRVVFNTLFHHHLPMLKDSIVYPE